MRISRRAFIGSVGGLAGLAVYSAHRGVRLPPFVWEPRQPLASYQGDGFEVSMSGLIAFDNPQTAALPKTGLRAFVPEPTMRVQAQTSGVKTLVVNNLSPKAELQIRNRSGAATAQQAEVVDESISGITRTLRIELAAGEALEFGWQISVENGYSFASIGDTGGQNELLWCIERAQQLGALFFQHLGDFYYAEGDYERTVQALFNAPLPCYVSLGNHDFHDGKLVYHRFLEAIGPFNTQFVLGGVRFINIDTASRLLPWSGGARGAFLNGLDAERGVYRDQVAFTHRPLFDPIEGSDHGMGSTVEQNWLIQNLKALGVDKLLSGHLHIYARQTIQGIDNIIAGQGLGHQDLITNSDYSKMILGRVPAAGNVEFSVAQLAMPWAMHCHPRNDPVKASLTEAQHAARIAELDANCE